MTTSITLICIINEPRHLNKFVFTAKNRELFVNTSEN